MKNSKLILSAAVAVSAILSISSASAADLAVKARPYIAAAPVFSWTGCYVGGHVGAGVLLDKGFTPDQGQENIADRHGVGGLAGGQIGCNYQTGMLVVGIEGEGFWSGMKITHDDFGNGNLANTLIGSAQIRNKWDYDVAARVGIAFDHALVYGKAGWVVGGFDWNYATTPAFGVFQFTNQGNATLDGLLIGVGLEYAFTNNWTAKFEYDYLGFGAKNVMFNGFCAACTPSTYTFTQNVSADKHIFKVGLNYLFNVGKGPGAASGADLAVRAMPMVAAPAFSWTGFYIGANAGAGVMLDQGRFITGLSADRHGVGGLAGGQIGFNYQMGMLVLGIEGEGFWSGMKATQDQFGGNPNTLLLTASVRNKWDYDIAGRFGIAFDRALIYGKAGWAFGGFDWNAADVNSQVFQCATTCITNQGSVTLDGLLIGLGLEYAFANNWTAKFEYDYLGFNAKDASFISSCPACTTSTFTHNVSTDKHIFKVGLNYLFNAAAPVVAKY